MPAGDGVLEDRGKVSERPGIALGIAIGIRGLGADFPGNVVRALLYGLAGVAGTSSSQEDGGSDQEPHVAEQF